MKIFGDKFNLTETRLAFSSSGAQQRPTSHQNKRFRVILVHGMFSNANFLSHLKQKIELELEQKFSGEYTVDAINLVGHGDRKNELGEKPISFYHYASDILAAAKQGPCIIVAHSLGALAALVAKSSENEGSQNISCIVTISASCPRGILLPLPVMIRMLFTWSYAKALITKKRFSLKKRHAEKFMLNSMMRKNASACYDNFEDESGRVLHELVWGIPLNEHIRNVHMIALGNDKVATPKMQKKLARRIGACDPIVISHADHMSLEDPLLTRAVTAKVLQNADQYRT